MNLDYQEVRLAAADFGFGETETEKAIRLLSLLETIKGHPYLKNRIALKGGTAINVFALELPRLSVDIDLNYIGAADLVSMLEDRQKIESAFEAVCGREGLDIKRIPRDHAGGKWRLQFQNTLGQSSSLHLDVNFMLRTPL